MNCCLLFVFVGTIEVIGLKTKALNLCTILTLECEFGLRRQTLINEYLLGR